MTLDPSELFQLQSLLQRRAYLTWEEEGQLRDLLRKQNPGAVSMTKEELIRYGLMLAGLVALGYLLRKK